MKNKNILITGSLGQLGKVLSKLLHNRFNIISTSKAYNDSCKSDYILDITDRNSVKKCFSLFNPQIIINCAAFTDVDSSETNKELAHDVNVKGLENIICFSNKEAYIVQISTDYVFDGKSGPYKEDDATIPINYYGRTKLEAENILRGSRRRNLIIRTNVNYSEDLNNKSNFFAWIYNSLNNNKTISVVNDQFSNPTFVLYLAELIFKSIIVNCEGIYHYGSSEVVSRYDFAVLVADVFSFDKSLILPVDTEYLNNNIHSYVAKRPKKSGLITDKIESLLNIPIYSNVYSLNQIKNILS